MNAFDEITQKRGFDQSPSPKVSKLPKFTEKQKISDVKREPTVVTNRFMRPTQSSQRSNPSRNPIIKEKVIPKKVTVTPRVNNDITQRNMSRLDKSLNSSIFGNSSFSSSKKEDRQILIEENERLKQKIYSYERREEDLKNEISRNSYNKRDEKRIEDVERKYRNLENDYFKIMKDKERIENERNENERLLKTKENEKEKEMNKLKEKNEKEIQEIKKENERFIKEIQEIQQKEIRNLQLNLNSIKIDLEYSVQDLNNCKNKIKELEKENENQRELIKEFESKILKDDLIRRKLHNQIQELKGNIRVYCRVRPLKENPNLNEFDHLKFIQDRNGIENGIDLEGGGLSKKYSFQFDKIFKPNSNQSIIFEEISQLVQSALDGYKVCIFAYGQTGSGKTFTMEGGDNENRGMISRSVEKIFETSKIMEKQGWKYSIIISFLEIYNETINDLLIKKPKEDSKYEIKHEKGNTTISDLEYKKVENINQVFDLLKFASKNINVAYTNCNERSSRSHSVFSLQIIGNNESLQQTTYGVLNLIDLAGSERLKESKSSGDRLKETQSINSSLAFLGDVIHALANKEKHIPFRNSKLTYLLQNYLGGDSKTLMFVNVAPNVEFLNETVNSLRFASKVNSCQIGTATKKVVLNK